MCIEKTLHESGQLHTHQDRRAGGETAFGHLSVTRGRVLERSSASFTICFQRITQRNPAGPILELNSLEPAFAAWSQRSGPQFEEGIDKEEIPCADDAALRSLDEEDVASWCATPQDLGNVAVLRVLGIPTRAALYWAAGPLACRRAVPGTVACGFGSVRYPDGPNLAAHLRMYWEAPICSSRIVRHRCE
jgi:hypothetical protein